MTLLIEDNRKVILLHCIFLIVLLVIFGSTQGQQSSVSMDDNYDRIKIGTSRSLNDTPARTCMKFKIFNGIFIHEHTEQMLGSDADCEEKCIFPFLKDYYTKRGWFDGDCDHSSKVPP